MVKLYLKNNCKLLLNKAHLTTFIFVSFQSSFSFWIGKIRIIVVKIPCYKTSFIQNNEVLKWKLFSSIFIFFPFRMNLIFNLTNGCFILLCEKYMKIELLLMAVLSCCHYQSLLGKKYFRAHLLFIIYDFNIFWVEMSILNILL